MTFPGVGSALPRQPRAEIRKPVGLASRTKELNTALRSEDRQLTVKRVQHRLRLPVNDTEKRSRRTFRRSPALLPILEGPYTDSDDRRKSRLRKTKSLANHLRIRLFNFENPRWLPPPSPDLPGLPDTFAKFGEIFFVHKSAECRPPRKYTPMAHRNGANWMDMDKIGGTPRPPLTQTSCICTLSA